MRGAIPPLPQYIFIASCLIEQDMSPWRFILTDRFDVLIICACVRVCVYIYSMYIFMFRGKAAGVRS
jgi:hypothetical protein